jgi:RNA polymerase sigma factor (sigma-70 family)
MYSYTPNQYDESQEVIQSYAHDRLLTKEEEKELFDRYHNKNDETAKEELIKYNMRLVINIANNYKGFDGAEMADLIQEGSTGLMVAIDKFKPEMNNKFSTYSYFWIEQRINRYIQDTCSSIRIPIHQREKLEKINKAYSFLTKKYDREPTKEEISEFTDFSIEELEDLSRINNNIIKNSSIHSSPAAKNDELITFISDKKEEMTDEKFIKEIVEKELISDLLDRYLRSKEQFIIKHRFGFIDGNKRTLEEIGNMLDLSRERIRQIESKCLLKLRKYITHSDRYRDLR